MEVKAYSYSDRAGCTTKRKYKTGFLILISALPVSLRSIGQINVALSSAVAEYSFINNGKGIDVAAWLCWEIKHNCPLVSKALIPTILIFTDNLIALAIAAQQATNARTKHIDVRFHHVKHFRYCCKIFPIYIPASNQLASLQNYFTARHSQIFVHI